MAGGLQGSTLVALLLFIYVHRKKLLVAFGIAFVVYLLNASSDRLDDPSLVRDSVKLCRELDDLNKIWRGLHGSRVPRALELQEMSLGESRIFQTPVAELVQAELDGDTGVSIGIRRDLSLICDQEASIPLPPP